MKAKFQHNLLAMNYSRDHVDWTIRDIARQFVNCITVFGQNLTIVVTGFDVFIHNNPGLDDCSYGIKNHEYEKIATPKIIQHANQGRPYYGLSIMYGHFELLATAGYIIRSASVVPFLGSSLGVSCPAGSGVVYVSQKENEYIRCNRLLRQHTKRDSAKPWSFHSTKTAVNGFIPANPLAFLNRPSQKFKKQSIHHFASMVLQLYDSQDAVNHRTVKDLLKLFTSIDTYAKHIGSRKVSKFSTMKKVLPATQQSKLCHLLLNMMVGVEKKQHHATNYQ